MDEHNPNVVPADSDYENYLSILQQMQNSVSDEEPAAASAENTVELIDEDELPLAPSLLATQPLSQFAVQEPEFDNLYATTGDLAVNGQHESLEADWSAMPTQPLVLPDGYLNGSSFAAFDIPAESLSQEPTELPEPSFASFDEISSESLFDDESEELADEMEAEMPTAFVFSTIETDEAEVTTAFAPPLEIDEEPETQTLIANDFLTAQEMLDNISEDIPEPEFDLSDDAIEMPVAAEFDLPSVMLLDEKEELPEPEFITEASAEDEEIAAPAFNFDAEMPAPEFTVDETEMPVMLEQAVAEEVEEPVFEDDFALPETNFLTSQNFTADLSSDELPEPSFLLDDLSDDMTLEEPEIMVLASASDGLTAETEIPLELSDAVAEEDETFVSELPIDFALSDETDVLETPAPPMALRGVAIEEEEIPLPENFEEFPSFIDEEDSAVVLENAEEFPENLDNGLSNVESDAENIPFAPAFQNLDAPAVLPNDFTQNGKHDFQSVPQTLETTNGAETAVKKHSAIESANFLEDRYIVFRLENELYGFPAASIKEIGHPLAVTPLPFVPEWFLGIANLRGDILTVLGLRELWGKGKAVNLQKPKMLVLHSIKQEVTVGLIVDQIREMRRVNAEEVSKNETAEAYLENYRVGEVDYEGQSLRLLDAEKFLESLKG